MLIKTKRITIIVEEFKEEKIVFSWASVTNKTG
jgi:hypothetical protein